MISDCFGGASRFHSTCCICRVANVKSKSGDKSDSLGHIWIKKKRPGLRLWMSSAHVLSSIVKQSFHNSQPWPTRESGRKFYQRMIPTSSLGTPCLMNSLWAATLFKEIKLGKPVLWISYRLGYMTPHAGADGLMLLHSNRKCQFGSGNHHWIIHSVDT